MSVINGLIDQVIARHPTIRSGRRNTPKALVSVAAIAQPVRPGLRAPVLWGLVIGVAQAATPLAF